MSTEASVETGHVYSPVWFQLVSENYRYSMCTQRVNLTSIYNLKKNYQKLSQEYGIRYINE